MSPKGAVRRFFTPAVLVAVVGLACTSDGGVGPGTPASVTVTPPDATVPSGQTLQISVTVRDSEGSSLPTSGVSWSSSDSQVATVSATGVVSALGVGGPVTVTATLGALTARTFITVVVGPVSQLSIATQPSASGTSGVPLGRQPVVQLRDANGNAVPQTGVQVTAVLAQGQGTLANAVSTTDALGRASFSGLTISGVTGAYRLRFEATGLTASTSDVIALSAVASLAFTVQPSATAQSGMAFATQPQVRVLNTGGAPVAGEPVTVTIASGGGTLAGTATVLSNGSGVAVFTGLSLTGLVGNRTLGFSSGSISIASGAIQLQAGAPASVVVLTQPSLTAPSGVVFARQPVVEVRDAAGNAVAATNVAASIDSGGGTLGGTTTVATSGVGRATFTNLSITGTAGARTLRFQAGAASALSATVDLTSGNPSTVTIVTQPSGAAVNAVPFGQQPVVEVRDDGGNPTAGLSVTAAVSSGAGTLGGTTTAVTNGSGVATFTNLSLTGLVGQYTLSFASGSASVQSAGITLSAGSASVIEVATQPSGTAQSSVAFAQQPRVDVRDSGGNPLSGALVSASIATGGGTLGGTTAVATNGAGRAIFTNLAIAGLLGSRTLRFQTASINIVSNPIDLLAGPLSALIITAQPSSNATNDAAFPQQPAVRAEDGAGNLIGSLSITAAILSGGGTLGGTTSVATNGSGIATFTNLKITGTVGARTLRFSNGGVNSSTSNQITVGAGTPTQVTLTTQPPNFTYSGVVFTQSPAVVVRDVSNNVVGGVNVVASILTGGGALGGTTTVATNGSGSATFGNLSISGTLGPRTLRFAAGGVQTSSSTVNVSYSAGTYTVTYCGSQQMDVFVPSASFPRPRPVAAYIHGGGWTSGDRATGLLLPEVRDELLSRGYVVVSLDYRLATEFDNQWPAQIHDVKCAVRHLRALAGDYGADGRIGVWGASAGGHLAAMLGVTDGSGFEGNEGFAGTSSQVDAAVSIGAISDLTQGPAHSELTFFGGEWTFGSWPGPHDELTSASPIEWASSGDPPFLIVHGSQDPTVFPAQATRLYDALDNDGAPVTLQIVTNGGHNLEDVGMGTPSHTLAQIRDLIADFFDAHVLF